MNDSELHKKLAQLYLLYFESGNQFEDTSSQASYYRTVRYLKQIEKLAKQRRLEVREKYKNTDYYKNSVKNGAIKKHMDTLRSKFGDGKNKKA